MVKIVMCVTLLNYSIYSEHVANVYTSMLQVLLLPGSRGGKRTILAANTSYSGTAQQDILYGKKILYCLVLKEKFRISAFTIFYHK